MKKGNSGSTIYFAEKDEKCIYGILDSSGNPLTELEFDYALPASDGLIAVLKDGKAGYLNESDGTWFTDLIFEESQSFKFGVGIVKINGFYGLLARNGELISSTCYSRIKWLGTQPILEVKKDGKVGIIGANGQIIQEPQYDRIEWLDSQCNFMIGIKGSSSIYIQKEGTILLDEWFDVANPFYDGFAIVAQNGLRGVLAADGTLLIKPIFGIVDASWSSTLLGRAGNKWGYYSLAKREWIFKPQFDEAESFTFNFIARVMNVDRKDGNRRLWGFVTPDGKWLTDDKFIEAESFNGGDTVNVTKADGEKGKLTRKGEFIPNK